MKILREMTIQDLPEVAHLSEPQMTGVSLENLQLRLKSILSCSGHKLWVSEWNQTVVGWVHAYQAPSFLSGPTLELGGIGVATAHRRQGLGRALIGEVETWAKRQKHAAILLALPKNAVEAQAFFLALNYQFVHSTYFLRKSLHA